MDTITIEIAIDKLNDYLYEVEERISIVEADGWKCTKTILKKVTQMLILKFERESI